MPLQLDIHSTPLSDWFNGSALLIGESSLFQDTLNFWYIAIHFYPSPIIIYIYLKIELLHKNNSLAFAWNVMKIITSKAEISLCLFCAYCVTKRYIFHYDLGTAKSRRNGGGFTAARKTASPHPVSTASVTDREAPSFLYRWEHFIIVHQGGSCRQQAN